MYIVGIEFETTRTGTDSGPEGGSITENIKWSVIEDETLFMFFFFLVVFFPDVSLEKCHSWIKS